MLLFRKVLAFGIAFALLVGIGFSQTAKKSYVFKGTVTEVDASSKKLVVANDNIPGWMAAMTMNYEVDDPQVLKKLKKGDRIEATVYDGDTKLYKVTVAAQQKN